MSAALSTRVLHCVNRKGCHFLFSQCQHTWHPRRWSFPLWRKRTWRPVTSSRFQGTHLGGDGGLPGQLLSSAGEDLDYQLSDAQVNAILRANEQSVRFSELDGRTPGPVLGFESNQLAANSPMEDRRSAVTCLLSGDTIFGVFDGHSGYACAQTVSERLVYYLAVALMSRQSLEELEAAMAELRPLSPILRWHKHHNDYNYRRSSSLYLAQLRKFWMELLSSDDCGEGLSPLDALSCAFQRMDVDISLEAQVPLESDRTRSLALETAFSGSTACVVHVNNEWVHVANAGDCRAVMGVQGDDGSWSALTLTQDHNALNEAELERIRSQHPSSEEDTVVMDERLLGVLMPLRAFGDVRFKWSLDLQKEVLESSRDLESLDIYEYTPPNYLTPPYLEATPELTYHRLRPGDRFLILASDGLWEMVDSVGAVRLVAEHLMAVYHQQEVLTAPVVDSNSATHLIRHAIGTNDYNEVDPERLAAMLTLPEEVARMYRDDITVTVIYFNQA